MNVLFKTSSISFVNRLFRTAILAAVVLTVTTIATAQAAKLSLADLLIGLRSQKVSLEDRNRILTEAVKTRGVTFTSSAVIENELTTTGASPLLIAAIREASQPKPEVKPVATPIPTPTPTPIPPDHTFFAKRAEGNANKGEFSLALADYDTAATMKPDDSAIFAGRARTHFNLKSFDKAVADYDKVVELSPKDPAAYYFRGLTYERAGKTDKALADYKKAAELDPKNENAVLGAKRLEDEIAKAAEAAKPKPVPTVAKAVRPEFAEVGTLSASNAERLVTPTYPQLAFRANIEGRVSVDIELDIEGKVVSAKATSGHQMLRQSAEDAARRSKFRPILLDNAPIKARGNVNYNFSLRPGSE